MRTPPGLTFSVVWIWAALFVGCGVGEDPAFSPDPVGTDSPTPEGSPTPEESGDNSPTAGDPDRTQLPGDDDQGSPAGDDDTASNESPSPETPSVTLVPEPVTPDGTPDGATPEDATPDEATPRPDSDGDGWADVEDCDPTDPDINPGATEVCGNSVDEDCSSDIDDGVSDLDGDGVVDVCDSCPTVANGACWTALPGMTHWWPGDLDGVEVLAGADASLNNGATIRSGMISGAFGMDDRGARDEDPASFQWVGLSASALDGQTDFSLELWVRTDDFECGLVSGANAGEGGGNEFLLYAKETALRVYVKGERLTFEGSISDGAWHQLVVTRDGTSGQVGLYQDGVSLAADAASLPTGAMDVAVLLLGQDQDEAGGGFQQGQAFGGLIDELSIFDRVLSPSEIEVLFAAGEGGMCLPDMAPESQRPTDITFYPDEDGDGFGAMEGTACVSPEVAEPYLSSSGDCDDGDPSVHPGATELCGNAIDENCIGGAEDGLDDGDGDGIAEACDSCPTWYNPGCLDGEITPSAWWTGDATFASPLDAQTATSQTLTPVHGVSIRPGMVGGAFWLDQPEATDSAASYQWLLLPPESLDGATDLTLEAWVWLEAGPGTLLSATSSQLDALTELQVVLAEEGLSVTLKGQTTEFSLGIPLQQWSHMLITRNGADGTVGFFLDGHAVPPSSSPLLPMGPLDVRAVILGASQRTVDPRLTLGDGLTGAIDELLLYGQSIDADDAQALFAVAEGGRCLPDQAEGTQRSGLEPFYPDLDRDGYGDDGSEGAVCLEAEALGEWVWQRGDCDDGDPAFYPGGVDIADGADNDCDGLTDETTLFYADVDGDGYGDEFASRWGLEAGYVAVLGDCDDGTDWIHPGASDVPDDGLDEDCGGSQGPDPHVGLSPDSVVTIAEAMADVSAGITIWVGPGAYLEHDLLWPASRLRLRATAGADRTVLDAGGAGRVLTLDGSAAEGNLLEGFTLQGGLADQGGGLAIIDALLTARACVIQDSSALQGAGLFSSSSTVALDRVEIRGNLGTEGGGLYAVDSSLELHQVSISENEALEEGGGIWIRGGSPALVRTTVTGNAAGTLGGGFYLADTAGTLENVLIEENQAIDGGGLYCLQSLTTMANLQVRWNAASRDGGGLYVVSSSPDIANTIVWGNGAEGVGGGIYVRSSGEFPDSSPELVNTVLGINGVDNLYNDPEYPGNVEISFGVIYGWDDAIGTDPDSLPASVTTEAPSFLRYDHPSVPSNHHLAREGAQVDGGDANLEDVDGSRSDIGIFGGPAGGGWDLDGDGLYDYYWPGLFGDVPEGVDSSSYDLDDGDSGG